ncbi:MAG: transporter permease [Subtercola sp.]|nr:transporter permease [Subtercola sp.]
MSAPAVGARRDQRGGRTAPLRRPSAGGRPSTLRRAVEIVLLIVLVLAAWQIAATSGTFGQNSWPTLGVFWSTAVETVPTQAYWVAIANTMVSWAIGLTISVLIAIPVGLLIGSTSFLRRLTTPTVDFMRTIPSIILVPLAVLLYGSTNQMKIILIVFASVWPLLLQAVYGIRAVEPVARETFSAYGVRWRDRVRFLYLPTASPYLATGLRLAAIASLLVAIGIEIIASAPGIGYQIGVKQANGLAASSFVYLITAAILGLIVTGIFTAVERRAMYWHPSRRGTNS